MAKERETYTVQEVEELISVAGIVLRLTSGDLTAIDTSLEDAIGMTCDEYSESVLASTINSASLTNIAGAALTRLLNSTLEAILPPYSEVVLNRMFSIIDLIGISAKSVDYVLEQAVGRSRSGIVEDYYSRNRSYEAPWVDVNAAATALKTLVCRVIASGEKE